MRRGDIVTAALPGDYGKPRPAVVIQSNRLVDVDSVLLCPITTARRDAPLFRLDVGSTELTGLRRLSQIMVEKITALRRDRVGSAIGGIDRATLLALDRLLASVVGLAESPGVDAGDGGID
jgi:mRNA interferase MazF